MESIGNNALVNVFVETGNNDAFLRFCVRGLENDVDGQADQDSRFF